MPSHGTTSQPLFTNDGGCPAYALYDRILRVAAGWAQASEDLPALKSPSRVNEEVFAKSNPCREAFNSQLSARYNETDYALSVTMSAKPAFVLVPEHTLASPRIDRNLPSSLVGLSCHLSRRSETRSASHISFDYIVVKTNGTHLYCESSGPKRGNGLMTVSDTLGKPER
jgi:hypothetical protein